MELIANYGKNQSNQRLFSNYYRVAFYGQKLEELDGTEYVYKTSNDCRLADLSERLKVYSLFPKLIIRINLDHILALTIFTSYRIPSL